MRKLPRQPLKRLTDFVGISDRALLKYMIVLCSNYAYEVLNSKRLRNAIFRYKKYGGKENNQNMAVHFSDFTLENSKFTYGREIQSKDG